MFKKFTVPGSFIGPVNRDFGKRIINLKTITILPAGDLRTNGSMGMGIFS